MKDKIKKSDSIRIKREVRDNYNNRIFASKIHTVCDVMENQGVWVEGNPNKFLKLEEVEKVDNVEYYYPKHFSDCAIYNEPAFEKGDCDCNLEEIAKLAYSVVLRIVRGDAILNFNESTNEKESEITLYDFLTVLKEHLKRRRVKEKEQ